jgi:hypothetical protein
LLLLYFVRSGLKKVKALLIVAPPLGSLLRWLYLLVADFVKGAPPKA